MRKSLKYLIFVSCLIISGASFSFAATCTKRLLAYYPYWNSNYRSDKIQYSKLTHICHAFAEPNADGTLYLDPGPPALLEPALITNAHAAGVKVLISIGGASSAGQPPDSTFRTISQSAALRTAFANNIASFCSTYGYDGVDIDWEMPGAMDPTDPGAADSANFDLMIQAIRTAFNSTNSSWLISIATSSDNWGAQWLDYPTLNNYVDFYNDMTYDMHGSWNNTMGYNAPLYQGNYAEDNLCDQTCMDYMMTTRGVPAEKINMGIPFYGQYFPGSNVLFYTCGNCSTTEANYSAIAPLIGNGWTYHWDAASQVPYLTNNTGAGIYSYDDAQSVGLKADYALNTRNTGGIFMWDLSEDYISAGNEPLLDAMYAKFSPFCSGSSPTSTPALTYTATLIPTVTFSRTPGSTNSPTFSVTKTSTVLSTATLTFTATPPAATFTSTLNPTLAFSHTPGLTNTPSYSATKTATAFSTSTLAFTATLQAATFTFTATVTVTESQTKTATYTETFTQTATTTAIPSYTQTFTLTATPTEIVLNTPTPTPFISNIFEITNPLAYPNPYNPASGKIWFRFNSSKTAVSIRLWIYTVSYRLVFEKTMNGSYTGASIISIDEGTLSNFANGVYYVVLTGNTALNETAAPPPMIMIILK